MLMMINMKSDGVRSYDDLVTAFGPDKIKSRYCFLERCARRFIENRNMKDYIGIHSFLIEEIVLDYFADIKRLKDFHEIERANPIKISAYTAFWVCRRKPLYLTTMVNDDILKNHRDLIEINEWFAVSILVSMAFDNRVRIFLNGDDLALWNSLRVHIQYFLVYRIFTPQALELAVSACTTPTMYPLRANTDYS